MKSANCTEKPPRLTAPATLSRKEPRQNRYRHTVTILLMLFAPLLLAQPAATDQSLDNDQKNQTDTVIATPETRSMSLLAESQQPESVVWLESDSTQFLALYEEDRSGNPVGAVLIVNAEGQHSSWPITSERIRLSFPEFGWNTLSTQLPPPQYPSIPARPASVMPPTTAQADKQSAEGNNSGESANAEPAETPPPEEKPTTEETAPTEANEPGQLADSMEAPTIDPETESFQRIQKAIAYLHERGQFNIVLMGQGVGAVRAACALAQLPEKSQQNARLIRALVLVDAHNGLPTEDGKLNNCLSRPDTPILDVYSGHSALDREAAKERDTSARRKRYSTYVQIQLPELAHNSMLGENRLSRRIRGFMSKHARGVKVDNAVIRNNR